MSDILSIEVEDFVKELTKAYSTYTDEVKKKAESGIRKIAKEAKDEVISGSPKGKVNLTRGYKRYKDGWSTSTKKKNGVFTVTVHNKKYRLIHLLELGHLLKDGTGRVYGEVPAYEHIKPARENAEEKVDKLLEEL